ncbi:MAG: B12-binding domain-containing radical SAM protein [Lachnospiraceae bacterium]|nr:B12-binding domain-containing radical SAM protein [Lachnospiraceae bacterium]
MKFLLVAVNSKFIHTNPALYSLRAYASQKENGDCGEHITIAEYTINNRMEEVLSGIYAHKPDVIAFSCYIWNISEIMALVKELPKILPNVPIWLGGPEVSYRAKEILESYPELTGIMVGEGEATFAELVSFYAKKPADVMTQLAQIKGIVFRHDNEIVDTGLRELTDLSKLPFLYDDLSQFEHKIIYYESSRGCPFRCSYCLSSIDKKVRLRDLDIVKKELQFFLDHKVPQVKFIDRTFNCNHTHAMEIWRYIKEHDNGITNFHFEIAADLINEEELELLNTLRPGAVQMEIGVQTTNADTLSEIRRKMDIDKLKAVVERLHQGNNIHIHLDLIAGLPFEDYASFANSFNEVYAMKPEQLQLGFLKVLSGSYMEEKCKDYELLYTDKPPYEVLSTKWISYGDVCRLKRIEEMVEIYYNSNQFTATLPYMMRFFDTPFAMFEKLAEFYEKKGYFVSTPSRVYRYSVLLQFITEETDGDEALAKELLTMDIYLRENAKSRPEFAKDLSAYKDKINSFYRLEEKRRETGEHLLPAYEAYEPRAMVRMLHMEPFSYDIFGANGSYLKMEVEKYMLFDYHKRNPLTYEADTMLLSGDFEPI